MSLADILIFRIGSDAKRRYSSPRTASIFRRDLFSDPSNVSIPNSVHAELKTEILDINIMQCCDMLLNKSFKVLSPSDMLTLDPLNILPLPFLFDFVESLSPLSLRFFFRLIKFKFRKHTQPTPSKIRTMINLQY